MGRRLTVKLDDVEPGALPPGPGASRLVLQATLLVCLALRQFPGYDQRHCDDGKDNADGSVGPAPVGLVELVGEGRAGKGSDNVGRGGEGVGDTSIAERGCIGGHHVDTEDDTGESDGVECLLVSRI